MYFTMGGPQSATFSDIYTVKMEIDIVVLSKSFIEDLQIKSSRPEVLCKKGVYRTPLVAASGRWHL